MDGHKIGGAVAFGIVLGFALAASAQQAPSTETDTRTTTGAELAPTAETEAAAADPPAQAAPQLMPPAASAAPGSAAPAVSNGPASCVLDSHGTVPTPDAETAATLVCAALREAGADVAQRVVAENEASAPAFHIRLGTLGETVVLMVRQEDRFGETRASRQLRLDGIEEMPKAAGRIAESLIHGIPLEDTASVDGLVGEETEGYAKRYGEFLFSLGVAGLLLPGADTPLGYGLDVRWSYDTADFSVGVGLHLRGASRGNYDAYATGGDVGGRYFLLDGDWSPFVGAGLGLLALGTSREGEGDGFEFEWSNVGLSPALEIGLEFLRLHESRMDILLRADVPLYVLEFEGYGYAPARADESEPRYLLPLTVVVSYSF